MYYCLCNSKFRMGHSVYFGILCFGRWDRNNISDAEHCCCIGGRCHFGQSSRSFTALAYLFGLLYVLNLFYPKPLKNTFDSIQNVFMELGSRCTQRVLSLKSKLMLLKPEHYFGIFFGFHLSKKPEVQLVWVWMHLACMSFKKLFFKVWFGKFKNFDFVKTLQHSFIVHKQAFMDIKRDLT